MIGNETTAMKQDSLTAVPFRRVAVIGAGAWGTALALTACRAGREVALWAREEAVVRSIALERRNPFLADTVLPADIAITGDLARALSAADLAILACPSQHLRAVARRVEARLAPGTPVVICSKGLEDETLHLMSDVVRDEMPGRPLAVLSGPTFAAEVAAGLPAAATVAAMTDAGADADLALASRVAASLATTGFRPYVSDDVIGVEIGGAVKNVIAIACGIAAGRGWGANARAALITRGLAEIARLGVAVGARVDTLYGLAGAGDLMLTCSSELSRNFSFGMALGQGDRPPVATDGGPVIEGAVNARAVVALAARHGIDMPIGRAVHAVLRGQPVDKVFGALMTRDLRAESQHLEGEWRVAHPARAARDCSRLSA